MYMLGCMNQWDVMKDVQSYAVQVDHGSILNSLVKTLNRFRWRPEVVYVRDSHGSWLVRWTSSLMIISVDKEYRLYLQLLIRFAQVVFFFQLDSHYSRTRGLILERGMFLFLMRRCTFLDVAFSNLLDAVRGHLIIDQCHTSLATARRTWEAEKRRAGHMGIPMWMAE